MKQYHRREYVLLERVLREQYELHGHHGVVLEVASAVADALSKMNPGFDKARFMAIVRGEEPLPSNIPPAMYNR